MNLVDAIYRFKLKYAWRTPMFLLQPILKRGNHIIFNELFKTNDLIIRKKIGPLKQIIGEYEAYPIVFENEEGKKKTLVFEKGDKDLPYGVVKVPTYKKDCFLFRVIDDNVFEVYVSHGNGAQSVPLLMMLMDGLLDKQIDLLLNKEN